MVGVFISAHPSAAFDHDAGAVAAVPARSAGAAVAASSSKSHKCDSEASGIKFFTLDRERQKRLRHATQSAMLAALHEEKKRVASAFFTAIASPTSRTTANFSPGISTP